MWLALAFLQEDLFDNFWFCEGRNIAKFRCDLSKSLHWWGGELAQDSTHNLSRARFWQTINDNRVWKLFYQISSKIKEPCGTANFAMTFATCWLASSLCSELSITPSLRIINAYGTSPFVSSGIPTTAASEINSNWAWKLAYKKRKWIILN